MTRCIKRTDVSNGVRKNFVHNHLKKSGDSSMMNKDTMESIGKNIMCPYKYFGTNPIESERRDIT